MDGKYSLMLLVSNSMFLDAILPPSKNEVWSKNMVVLASKKDLVAVLERWSMLLTR